MSESDGAESISAEQLLAEGKHTEAALAYFRRGDALAAQKIYERLWSWGAAAHMARERGDRPDELRLLLEARELAEAAKVGQLLREPNVAAAERDRAAHIYEQRQMWPEAAALWQASGQLPRARDLYVKAALYFEAAQLEELLGRARAAGQLYERFLAGRSAPPPVPGTASDGEVPRARLALARILASFSQLEPAARQLQRAIAELCPDGAPPPPSEVALAVELRSELVRALLRLGHAAAAELALSPLRTLRPDTPPLDSWSASTEADPKQPLFGGRYRLEELIGGGGMGRVYRGTDELSGQRVALKLVARTSEDAPGAPRDDGYRRFVREAQTVASLRHPNIVRLLHVDEPLGLLVMELMADTLEERLAAAPTGLAPSTVQALALQLAAALEAAHARGIIHRDVKPSNIFLSPTGEAKLGDFGVAHLQALGATQTAGFIGTLAFMSPEQISGAPLTFAADLYGLGITLFVALTGRLPFVGPDFVSAHLGELPPSPSQLSPAAAPFDAIVLRLLAKAPSERFEDLAALRHALMGLRNLSAQTTVAAPPVEPPPSATSPAATSERYVLGAPSATTPRSAIFYATDRVLGRAVVAEQFVAGFFASPEGARHLAWIRQAAQLGGPALQRVLSLERAADGSGRAIFEAASGAVPVGGLTPDARAQLDGSLTALRAAGWSHDQEESILVDERGPTLLLAGHSASATG